MTTIIERALEYVPDDSRIGLGSGRAARAFVEELGQRVGGEGLARSGSAHFPRDRDTGPSTGIPCDARQAEVLDLTVDGADEVDPRLDLIKGYGRAFVREKIVAASSRRLIILVGDEKLVPQLGDSRPAAGRSDAVRPLLLRATAR